MTPKRIHYPWSLENFDDGYVSADGRFRVYLPDHPKSDRGGYIRRSLVAYEAYHGKVVPREMVVHHIDGDKLNDSKENLKTMLRRGPESHSAHHHSGENNPRFGMTGEKNPMWGMSGERSPRWKGDDAKPASKYTIGRGG